MKRSSKIISCLALAACLAFPLGCETTKPTGKTPSPPHQPTLGEIARKATRGDKRSQEQLAARYASGNEVVKDDILSEQWLLRANPKMSPTSGGNANASIQKKQAEKAAAEKQAQVAAEKAKAAQAQKTAVAAAAKTVPSAKKAPASAPGAKAAADVPAAQTQQPDDFQMLLRKASQGDRAALNKIRNDAATLRQFKIYAKTPEGSRNPFVREVQNRLKQ